MEKITATIDLIDGSEVEVNVEVDFRYLSEEPDEDEITAEVMNEIKEKYPKYKDKIVNITI